MNKIDLGGTARSPEEVASLYDRDSDLPRSPLAIPPSSCPLSLSTSRCKRNSGSTTSAMAKRRRPQRRGSAQRCLSSKVLELFPVMQSLSMRLLTIHLWLDRRFVQRNALDSKLDILKENGGESSGIFDHGLHREPE